MIVIISVINITNIIMIMTMATMTTYEKKKRIITELTNCQPGGKIYISKPYVRMYSTHVCVCV